MKPRLSADFRFALMVLFGGLAVLAITPFAVYRFASGQLVAGLVDVLIELVIVAIVAYAWRSGNMDRAGLLASLATSAGCVAVGTVGGLAGALWLYPVLVANFLLAGRMTAIAISAGAVLAMVSGDSLGDWPARGSFAASAIVLSVFAWLFSNHSEQQRLHLERLAGRDPLTGALNRRGMDGELQAVIAAAGRDGAPAGLAVLDLDDFKQVNDRHGHEAGDGVLVQFAELVRRATRASDRLYRTGGEEFVLLMPGADAATLARIARGLRRAVRDQVRCGGEPVTVSIGATPVRPDDSVASWYARADRAMYRAKREGRDRAVVDAGVDPAPGGRSRG
ncbi:diguanylate cyclase [Lysobacter sp. GX 14042]|uniref:GGDEF domain-containing protein n=1 Tax=Lysobacter sp. GX 14042 TaxID=2907155 RepID=UPI001F22E01E|nr:GGDEF domain-containing protein [Lysobacter sp. GX 14042]MCE7032323.1 diguanylate cyclase [Lysobacter sp. GX 14042]